MNDSPELTVCILAYNEEDNLGRQVSEIREELATLKADWELIIVNDGSSDGTGTAADRLADGVPNTRVVHHPENRGLGGGYRTGFEEARGRWLTFYPADCQFPASIISQFMAKRDGADLVLGHLASRPSLVGRFLSLSERILYRLLLGEFPKFQGILLLRRALLDEIPLHSQGRGWGVIMEFVLRVHRAGRYRVIGEQTEIRQRLSGKSKVQNPRSIVANLSQLWALRRTLDQEA